MPERMKLQDMDVAFLLYPIDQPRQEHRWE